MSRPQPPTNSHEIGLSERRATTLKLLDYDAGHDGATVKLIHRDVEECSGGTALGGAIAQNASRSMASALRDESVATRAISRFFAKIAHKARSHLRRILQ